MGVRYTRELLEEAARHTTTWDQAVRWCGGTPTPGSRRYLRGRMAAAGIDVSHFPDGRVRHTEKTLRELAASADSIRDVVRGLGIAQVGGNHTHISRRMAELGIDTSHFTRPPGRRPRGAPAGPLTLRDPESGRIPGRRLHRALLRSGVEDVCALCGTGDRWNGKPLRLEVDHVNGDWWDNRVENLRLLCPNCHAVTDTYRGRKRRTER
ncbi:HNH endonuclease [Streptomyces sp. NPDC000594]|uniref:HNH endonuclease n=1 Tax=Streptomyces sp. NPDC000594 TaxID=3154261 RepID=UPI00332FD096